jgi:hypothetical protein
MSDQSKHTGHRPGRGEPAVETQDQPQYAAQPHGQAGQPANRPAQEGHQGITPIQPEEQDNQTGVSPTVAVTHGDPVVVVGTEYTGRHRDRSQR